MANVTNATPKKGWKTATPRGGRLLSNVIVGADSQNLTKPHIEVATAPGKRSQNLTVLRRDIRRAAMPKATETGPFSAISASHSLAGVSPRKTGQILTVLDSVNQLAIALQGVVSGRFSTDSDADNLTGVPGAVTANNGEATARLSSAVTGSGVDDFIELCECALCALNNTFQRGYGKIVDRTGLHGLVVNAKQHVDDDNVINCCWRQKIQAISEGFENNGLRCRGTDFSCFIKGGGLRFNIRKLFPNFRNVSFSEHGQIFYFNPQRRSDGLSLSAADVFVALALVLGAQQVDNDQTYKSAHASQRGLPIHNFFAGMIQPNHEQHHRTQAHQNGTKEFGHLGFFNFSKFSHARMMGESISGRNPEASTTPRATPVWCLPPSELAIAPHFIAHDGQGGF